MAAKTTFVLDTNVLIFDPQSIFKFEEHDVVLPLKVLEELDQFKSEMTERGRAARTVARTLDAFRSRGNLFDGIQIERPDGSEAGALSVAIAKKEDLNLLPPALEPLKPDNIIIATVLSLPEDKDVVFITLDVGLRLRCDSLKIHSEAYRGAKADKAKPDFYLGYQTIEIPGEEIDTFYLDKEFIPKEDQSFHSNEYVLLKAIYNGKSAIGRYNPVSQSVEQLYKNTDFHRKGDPHIWGIEPKNVCQRFALDALLDDNIKLVTLTGKAGSGKTLMALAAGLYLTADEGHYNKVLAARPIFPMGKDLGFLPGDLDEKLAPWMQPIYDNADLLLNAAEDEEGRKRRGHQELVDMGLLEIEALTYVRGRSIPRQYMIIDEAQNLTVHELKTIITRAGEGTKIVLTGDPDQIDNPLLDKSNNGLVYVINKFKDKNIAAHITLEKGERSALATIASEIL